MATATPMRVLIADDELLARQRLEDLLAKVPDIEVVAQVDNGNKAVAAIREYAPDLVFLDVQMPGMTALQIVQEIGAEHMPLTIFVTAYDKYALAAFEASALDYLLKPFSNKRFEAALSKAQRLHQLKQSGDIAERLKKAMSAVGLDMPKLPAAAPGQKYLERLAVESRGQVRVIHTDEIDYITASGVYAELHVGEKTYVLRESMQTLEERLDPQHFFRVHRSSIVQLNRIEMLLREAGSDYTLKLKSGVQLMVGRTRVKKLEQWMGLSPQGSV